MRVIVRILIVLLVAAALPLRGYAAVAADLCAEHHGGAQSVQLHDHGSPDAPAGHGGEHSSTSSCSHCASCSVGASVAPEAKHLTLPVAGSGRIPFLDYRKPAHVPDHPDRPPLVS